MAKMLMLGFNFLLLLAIDFVIIRKKWVLGNLVFDGKESAKLYCCSDLSRKKKGYDVLPLLGICVCSVR